MLVIERTAKCPGRQVNPALALTHVEVPIKYTIRRKNFLTFNEWFALHGCLLQTNPETHASPSCLAAAADPV